VYGDLSDLLVEVVDLYGATVDSSGAVTSKALYAEFTYIISGPKVKEPHSDFLWQIAWLCLAHPSLPGLAANVVSFLLNNILLLKSATNACFFPLPLLLVAHGGDVGCSPQPTCVLLLLGLTWASMSPCWLAAQLWTTSSSSLPGLLES
jgi:hypothetical protein